MNRLYTVLILVAIIGIVAYFLFSALQPQYYVRTSFILIPKSDAIGSQMDRVAHDVAFVMRDAIAGDDIVAQNNAKVTVTQVNDTNIISVLGYGKTSDIAKTVQSHALSRMVQHVRKYYADDTIAMQVVHHDRMPQKTFSAQSVPYLIIFFIGVGLIAGVFAVFHYIDQFREQVPQISGEKIFEKFHKNRMQKIAQTDVLSAEEVIVEQKDVVSADDIEKPVEDMRDENVTQREVVGKKETNDVAVQISKSPDVSIPDGISATPGNLPIVDISSLGFAARKEEKSAEQKEQPKEPTEEELKARLNALLNGKL